MDKEKKRREKMLSARRKKIVHRWYLSIIISLFLVCLVFSFWRANAVRNWVFNINAETSIVELTTPDKGEIRWRVNGARICSKGKLSGASLAPLSQGCPNPKWHAYEFSDPEQTLILSGVFRVTFETRQDQSLIMSLREKPPPKADKQTQAKTPKSTERKRGFSALLTFTDGREDISLAVNDKVRVNFTWPSEDQSGGKGRLATDRFFPFSAAAAIGRDVNWTGTSVLSKGKIGVHVADVSADKRHEVDRTTLLLGDRVQLGSNEEDGAYNYPKGFIRKKLDSNILEVIAFGEAQSIRIIRYGGNDYEFGPSILTGLRHDPLFIPVISLVVGLITLLGTLDAILGRKG